MMAYGENTSLAERKKRAALRMILGFEGTDISPEIRKFAKRYAWPRQVVEAKST